MSFFTQASNLGAGVDRIFFVSLVASVLILAGITGLMIYFTVRYSRRRNPEPVDIEGHFGLEVVWTLIPLVLFLAMFYFGWTNFREMRTPPADAMVIKVTARQWAWSFKYPNGRVTEELRVAHGRPVKLEMKSIDVLHGFYIAAFRVKADVLPGRMNFLWFTPTIPGTFDIQCTVICGVDHSAMLSKIHVLPEEDFKKWYFTDPEAAAAAKPAKKTARLLRPAALKARDCLTCHTLDGTEGLGPTLQGMFGRKQTVRTGGKDREAVVDEAYLERALTDPGADVPPGFSISMPKASLTPEEIAELTAYIRSLK
ncbi:MAG: cytochrome c oxidase subunit II [Elusimicrobiota bacterium]